MALAPIIELHTSSNKYRPCQQVTFAVDVLGGVGNSDYSIKWHLGSMGGPYDAQTFDIIKQHLMNMENISSITLPILYLLPPNEYTFKVEVPNFWGVSTFQSVTLSTLATVLVRRPFPDDICTPPSRITILTFPNRRTTIQLKFDKDMFSSAEDVTSALILILTIGPNNEDDWFSYEIVKLSSRIYEVKLTITRSLYDGGLTVRIVNNSLLQDKYLNEYLGPSKYTQALYDVDFYTDEQITRTQQASQAATGSLISTVIPIIVFGSGPLIISFLNGAQVINFLRLINVYYPINVDAFLTSLNDIHFDFLPNVFEFTTDWIKIPFVVEDQEAPLRFAKNTIIRKLMEIQSFLEYNAYLVLLDSTYYQHGMAIFLQIRNISYANAWNKASFIASLCSLSFYIGFPIFCYIQVRKKYRIHFTKHSSLLKHFGILVEGLDLRRKRSRMFFLIILARKALYCAILVFFHDYPLLEMGSLILLNLVFLGFLLFIRRFASWSQLKKEILCGGLLMGAHIGVLFIKLNEEDSLKKFQIGWVVISFCMGIILIFLCEGLSMMIPKLSYIFKWKLLPKLMTNSKIGKQIVKPATAKIKEATQIPKKIPALRLVKISSFELN